MKYDVFISYSSNDQKVAEAISHHLEENKIRCFIAYRDIPKGVVWSSAITDAIENCLMMLVVFSEDFNNSNQADWEIEMCSKEKRAILTYRITDTVFEGAKKYYLKDKSVIDAFPNPKSNFGELLDSICKLINEQKIIIENRSKKLRANIKGGANSPKQPEAEREITRLTTPSGDTYVGEVDSSGIPDGKGIHTWTNGDSYEGGFIDGRLHGKGVYIFADGDRYEGDFVEDEMHGKGVYICANGDRYEGDYVNGDRYGKGVATYVNGDKYEGDFAKGNRHGKGVYTYANGDKYEGDFANDKQHGKGIYTCANGNKYEGDYFEDKMHGKGVTTYVDGDKHEGNYADGNRHGKGVYTWANGDKYEGGFANDKQHGKGIYTWADGRTEAQEFKEGVEI
ncbi:MAG: TIR domain-containing protein [Rikenellaceae bacterium]